MSAPGVTQTRPARRRWRWPGVLPKGLYTRSLLIIILPMLLLQSVIAFVFMERHWEQVTRRLSTSMAQDIAAMIEVYEALPVEDRRLTTQRIAAQTLALRVDFLDELALPTPVRAPYFSILDRILAEEIAVSLDRPFWIDTISGGGAEAVEIRVRLDREVMRIFARRSQTYASNSHIFLVWMVAASAVLITVSILFLRNQIRPILQLANAAENLGKGRDAPNFRPRGAKEIRRASIAFFAMKARIERQIDQRTTMLAGVSHDLRTVLTRLRLQLALIGSGPEIKALESDVSEMERMLQDYMAFARGDAGESATPTDIQALVGEVVDGTRHLNENIRTEMSGPPRVIVKADALRRAVTNLVTNAARFGEHVVVGVHADDVELVIVVDDDGPGIPRERREDVFRPFFRIDEARNQDHAGSGLGLAIALDIARGHGGDIDLAKSPLGGLRARFRIPV